MLHDHMTCEMHVHASILKHGYQSAKKWTKSTKETTYIS